MLDTAQVVLMFVALMLTFLIVILGVQVFFILREFRQTLIKANKLIDDAGLITETISGPLATLATLATGIKTGASVAKFINGKKKLFEKFIDGEKPNE